MRLISIELSFDCISLTYRRPPTLSSAARDDGKQQVRGARPACEYRVRSRVVIGRVVRVRRAADAVARLDIEPYPMTLLEHHAGGPDLDVDAHRLAGLEHFARSVPVIRPIRKRQRRIELAVRRAEPAFGHGNRLTL